MKYMHEFVQNNSEGKVLSLPLANSNRSVKRTGTMPGDSVYCTYT